MFTLNATKLKPLPAALEAHKQQHILVRSGPKCGPNRNWALANHVKFNIVQLVTVIEASKKILYISLKTGHLISTEPNFTDSLHILSIDS